MGPQGIMWIKVILALSLLVTWIDCAPLDVHGCDSCNTGSKWPPYANADSSKGYWELKAENGSSAKKVKKSPTTEEIKAAIAESIAELKNKKNVGTLQKPLERRKYSFQLNPLPGPVN